MSVHDIQKGGLFSMRNVIQKVLRVLKFLFLGENVILKWDVLYLRVHRYCNNDFRLASSVGVNSVRESTELFFQSM